MSNWWRDAVAYQIYIRSFADAGVDGIGDLAGITARLEHVRDLGADAIWLTPFFPSPQRDHGYDVADYFDVEPEYGSLGDFDRLVETARSLDLRVMADIVPNHCSSDHAWFREALDSLPGSSARDRFYFRDGRGENGELPPNNWVAMFGGPAWTRVEDGQWYLHSFTQWQPDLNWDDERVPAMFDDVLRFWFDRGVDGFRVDAVTHLGKAPGLPDAPPLPPGTRETAAVSHNPYMLYWPSAHDVWRRWRAVVGDYQDHHPDRDLVLIAEAYTPGRIDLLLEYVRPDEFHQAFSFDLLLAPWNPVTLRRAIDETYTAFTTADAPITWTLNNHDTQRSVTRYGRAASSDASSWTGSNLVYPDSPVDLAVGTRRARAAVVLLAALPGSMYIYQGEELGLPEVLELDDAVRSDPIFARTEGREIGRDGCRVPLPWTRDAADSHGFSAGPSQPWLPQPAGWGERSVEVETRDPASMASLYRAVLARRGESFAESGDFGWYFVDVAELVAFRRGDVVVVLNPTTSPVSLPWDLGRSPTMILSSQVDHHDVGVVPADCCAWFGLPA